MIKSVKLGVVDVWVCLIGFLKFDWSFNGGFECVLMELCRRLNKGIIGNWLFLGFYEFYVIWIKI